MNPMRIAARAPMEAELTLTRHYPAPPELVFRAWTDPVLLARWWGPRGFTNTVCEVDARVGGGLRIVMRSPDGDEHPMRGVFREVTPHRRITFTNTAVDADDDVLLDGLTTVSFEPHAGGTRLTLHTHMTGKVPLAAQMLAGMEAGWGGSLDKLGEHLQEQRT